MSVTADDDGQRIDNYLLRRLKGLPRTRLYRLLRKGEIRVNGGRVKPVYRVRTGDDIRLPPLHGLLGAATASIPPRILEQMQQAIVHEERDLLVLNKPAGMAVHAGSGLAYGIIEALRALRPTDLQLELVHRLDRETSGCLLVARRRAALRTLHGVIRDNRMEKRYLALLAGRLPRGATPVEAALDPEHRASGERMVRVDRAGKSARSVFRRVAVFGDWSLAEVAIDTGRTHQIRVHAAHIGHPLVGDTRYGDTDVNGVARRAGLGRLFLHAHELCFEFNGRQHRYTVALPPELQGVVDTLKGDSA